MNLTIADQKLIWLVKDGQSGKYSDYIRAYSGRVRQLVELKHPLSGELMVMDIDKLVGILNPALTEEWEWFQSLRAAVREWTHEKVAANRLLGLTNDNQYDQRPFEKAVRQHLFSAGLVLPDHIKGGVLVEVPFSMLVEMVEVGIRRFGM